MSNNGSIKQFKLDSGYSFEAYIPANVTSDTKIIVYEHGNGGYTSDWKRYMPYFDSGNCNAIVIHADRKYTTDLAACVASQYDIDMNNTIPVGFSGGGVAACYSAADIAAQGDGENPNLAVLLEGSCPFYYLESKGVIDAYKNNNTVFLYFENDSGYQQTQYAKAMAESGVNVLIFEDYVANGHTDISASFMSSGLMDFTIGEGSLPQRYVIKAYDKEKGWYTVDPSTITNINSIYNLFGLEAGTVVELKNYTLAELSKLEDLTLNSSQKELETYLNGIRGAIRSTSLSTAGLAGGFSSTTMMPSQIPAVVSRYVQSTTSFLSKLACETDQFAMIGESIKNMDFNLERIARDINNIEIVSAVYGSSSETKSNDNNTEENNVTLVDNKTGDTKSDWATSDTSKYTPVVNNLVTYGGTSSLSDLGSVITNNVNTSEKDEQQIFEKYNNVISNDKQLVIECDKGYKIVIHKDGDNISSVEHYYEFNSESEATSMFTKLIEEYSDKYYFKDIVQNGPNVKVILNSDVYKGHNFASLEDLYSKVEGYKKV